MTAIIIVPKKRPTVRIVVSKRTAVHADAGATATAALAIEDNNHSSTYTPAENLARLVLARVDSVAAKLRDLEADIRQLWVEFDNLKDGETILGCATKKEFCEKKLHRTPRTIQYLLAGQSNPADRPHKEPSELSSPQSVPQALGLEVLAYPQLLKSITQRILARDGADKPYTDNDDEPLGWRTRNTVRVRITKIVHNMEERRTFWFELSRVLWPHGWAGNTVFRENRREAWIFHWMDPKAQPDRPKEMPDDWTPITDLAPQEPSADQRPQAVSQTLSHTFHAIRHKASGFFVDYGCGFSTFVGDGGRTPTKSLAMAKRLAEAEDDEDDEDEDGYYQMQLEGTVRILCQQREHRKSDFKVADFEVVEVHASYTVTAVKS